MTTWVEFDEIFGINGGARRAETPEHLADITDTYKQTYEVTVNFKQDKLTLMQHVNAYRELWNELRAEYNTYDDHFEIEYCRTGQAHLHGYITIRHPMNCVGYEDSFMLRMIAKSIFKRLPKKYWKQYVNAKVDSGLRRLKCPALCLNMKQVLENNWNYYIEKNAPKKARSN